MCKVNPCTINNGDTIGSTARFRISKSKIAYKQLFLIFLSSFSANSTKTLTYRIDAWLGSFKIPLDFVPSNKRDACQSLQAPSSCPADFGSILTHEIELPVEAPYEDITIHMEAQMIDEYNVPIFCYRTTVTVLPRKVPLLLN